MFAQLLIGTFMIGATVVLHALALDAIIRLTPAAETAVRRMKPARRHWKAVLLAFVVLCVYGAHVAEIWLWATLYYYAGAVSGFEDALYYSTTSFTTVGFGDFVLGKEWRLLGSIEAANGFMLFGWSTAFVFEVMSQLYRREGENIKTK